MTMFRMALRPASCFRESEYAIENVNSRLTAEPSTVMSTETNMLRYSVSVEKMNSYALSENVLGIIKNGRAVSSLSVAKEPAIMYRNGNMVHNASKARKR